MKGESTMYKVIDWYEDYLLIGIFDTYAEAKQAARAFAADTDDECNIEIVKEN